jgi:hypothetical protein
MISSVLRNLPVQVAFVALTFTWNAWAGPADVVDVKVTKSSPGVYGFSVTVRHGDTGWQHYADAWEVVGPDGKVLGTRVLGHPHVNEQPFTRRLSGVAIAEGIKTVRLRARDKVHGFGGREMDVDLP